MAPAPVIAAFDPVALDPAPVRLAATLAAVMRAPLFVASVHAGDDTVDLLTGGQLGEEDLAPGPSTAADRVVGELRREGVDAEVVTLGAASAARALSLAAEELGAGLITVGSAARAEPKRLEAGSTAQRLLNGAPCAVAVTPLEWVADHELTVVGAGFVDTREGRDAVRGAHALADRAGSVLRVLAAVQPRTWMLPGGAPGHAGERDEEGFGAIAAQMRARAEDAAQAAVAGLLGAPVDVDVVVGEPAHVLRDVTTEVELLVCGSRGYGPPAATLVGGVTRRLTADAACPVLVTAHAPVVALEALLGD